MVGKGRVQRGRDGCCTLRPQVATTTLEAIRLRAHGILTLRDLMTAGRANPTERQRRF